MVSDKKYLPTRELQQQRAYWARRESDAKLRKQAYEKFLDERGAHYGVGVGLDASGEQVQTITRTGPAPDFTVCPPDDHLWIGHYDLKGLTHRMCINCGIEEKAVLDAPATVEAFRKRHPEVTEFWRIHGQNTIMGQPAGDITPLDELASVAKLVDPKKAGFEKPEPFFGRYTIFGVDGEHPEPYMTRYWLGRLRLHIFHRGDNDPDPHDHPWDFWTFPLTSYVEEVTTKIVQTYNHGSGAIIDPPIVTYETRRQVVRAFRLHFRLATHTHRVLGRYDSAESFGRSVGKMLGDSKEGPVPAEKPGKIVTIVWRGVSGRRKWGFLKKDATGKRCWIPWKTYVYEGGKHAPCE